MTSLLQSRKWRKKKKTVKVTNDGCLCVRYGGEATKGDILLHPRLWGVSPACKIRVEILIKFYQLRLCINEIINLFFFFFYVVSLWKVDEGSGQWRIF